MPWSPFERATAAAMAALDDCSGAAEHHRAQAVARAVLEAMAEPSLGMIAAADAQHCGIDTRGLWQCMLRAALHDQC